MVEATGGTAAAVGEPGAGRDASAYRAQLAIVGGLFFVFGFVTWTLINSCCGRVSA